MALKNQMDSMLPKKGMSYGELIVDNILGLDNDYERLMAERGDMMPNKRPVM